MWLLSWIVAVAAAHPYSNNVTGQQVVVRLGDDQVRIDSAVELPTIPLLKELRAFLGDVAQPGPADQLRFDTQMKAELHSGWRLLVDGQPVPLEAAPVEGVSGVGDARFVTYRLAFVAPLHPDARTVQVVNQSVPDQPTLFHVDVLVDDTVALDLGSPYRVVDGALRGDQTGRWVAQEELRDLRFSLHRRSEIGAWGHRSVRKLLGEEGPSAGRDALSTVDADLLPALAKADLSPWQLLLVLLAAAGLGAAHGLSPGHGKALVAAWLVGQQQARLRDAARLALVVTVTHTLSVYALGAVALVSASMGTALLPWMELASGLLILAVGVGLLRSRWRGLIARRRGGASGHEHSHDHDHGHSHGHAHGGDPEGGGQGLIAMGISGGLVPCPSAMVVLLSAVALDRTAFGLVLVTAFSAGLALLVFGVGALVVLLGDRLGRGRALPGIQAAGVVAAVVVVGLGAAFTLRALVELGGGTAWTH
jgi:nickel/cobalt transporter (NicO) family protein